MFAKINCPQCDKALKVRQEHSGRTVRCPYCHSSIQVSAQLIEQQQAAAESDVRPELQIDITPKSTRSKKGSGSSRKKSAGGPSRSAASGDQSGIREASLLKSGLMALAISVVFLLLIFPLRQFTVVQLFWDRGLVPPVLVLLMCWSLVLLFLKWRNLVRQREAMLLDVLPTEIAHDITPDSLDQFIDHIQGLPVQAGDSMLVNRVLRGLGHFRVRKSAAETVTMMESQSAIDANSVASSYTLVKVFLWSLPILGFIGTVIGISQAVAGLAGSLEAASDVSAIKGSLNAVFSGLGTAFDTTLLALVMSLIVKIIASALQKSEEDLVTWVDEYCNENLLRRLNDGRRDAPERGDGGDLTAMRKVMAEALAGHQAELENWKKKLDLIGREITAQAANGWNEIGRRHAEQMQQQMSQWQKQQQEFLAQWGSQLKEMGTAAEGIQQSLAETSERSAALPQQLNESLSRVADGLVPQFAGVNSGLNNLNDVLQQLGTQQVIVQQVEAPRRRWFWSGRGKPVTATNGSVNESNGKG